MCPQYAPQDQVGVSLVNTTVLKGIHLLYPLKSAECPDWGCRTPGPGPSVLPANRRVGRFGLCAAASCRTASGCALRAVAIGGKPFHKTPVIGVGWGEGMSVGENEASLLEAMRLLTDVRYAKPPDRPEWARPLHAQLIRS